MMNRRETILGGLAAGAVMGASTAEAAEAEVINSRVDVALRTLYDSIPGTRELAGRAHGVLVMPRVIKGGFILGGSYGEGALRLNPADGLGQTAQFYSLGAASVGFQAGVQQTAHALFFLSRDALEKFRRADGWEAGLDAEVTIVEAGLNIGTDSTVLQKPIVAFVFNQSGVLAGASVEGAKYTRIIR
ncbi:MAG: YSC84-related protein [Pseudomonadota bacterium]